MRFASIAALILVITTSASADKRRAVRPGDGARCLFGTMVPLVVPQLIALDATHIYYVDDFTYYVFRAPKRGGTPEKLYETAFEDTVAALAVDDTNVYVGLLPFPESGTVIPPGRIVAFPKSGGLARTIATDVRLPNDIASDATHVYWVASGTLNFATFTIESDGKIERVRKDGTGRQTLAAGLSFPWQLVLDDDTVFFSETGFATSNPNGGLRRIGKDGSAFIDLTTDWLVADVEQTENELVFLGVPEDNESAGGIHRMTKNGGTVTPVNTTENIAEGLRVFGDRAYFLTEGEDSPDYILKSVPLTGGPPQTHRVLETAYADFEVDACAVYYGSLDEFGIVAIPR